MGPHIKKGSSSLSLDSVTLRHRDMDKKILSLRVGPHLNGVVFFKNQQ